MADRHHANLSEILGRIRLGSTLSSISFTRNAASYCSSPRAWSHAGTSTLASPTGSVPLPFSLPQPPRSANTQAVWQSPRVLASCYDTR